MTIQEFALSIAHTLGRDEDYFFIEKIKKDTNLMRDYLFRQDQHRYMNDQMFVQTFCDDLVEKPIIECCGREVDDCDTILRTKNQIPVPIARPSSLFRFVGDLNLERPYTEIRAEDYPKMRKLRYAGNKPMYAYFNNYIYLFNPVDDGAEKVAISGIFADPDKVTPFKCTDGSQPCYTHDSAYPASSALLEAAKRELLNQYRLQLPTTDREVKADDGKVQQ